MAGFKIQRISSGSCSSLAFDHGMYILFSCKNVNTAFNNILTFILSR